MMRFFTKNRSSKKRIVEEWMYEQVANELDSGDIRRGLWTKARGLSEGDTNKCESIYIQLRAESIVDEKKVIREAIELRENQQKHKFEKAVNKETQTRKVKERKPIKKTLGRFAIYINDQDHQVVDTNDFLALMT